MRQTQFVKANQKRSKFGLQHGTSVHTEQLALKTETEERHGKQNTTIRQRM